ncbi:MAG: tRNA pseudouridine(55) synthase TruB [Bacteroidota bacterium]
MEELNFEEGVVLLIDKPYTWTSFDAVRKIRNSIRIKKIGHAGTLDPLATGLLIMCTGKFTKQIDKIQNANKEYICEMTIGKTTPSFDLETEVDAEFPFEHVTKALFLKTAEAFTGEIAQVPPMFSALKVDGQRLYKLARKGETIELKSRDITIHAIELLVFDAPVITFRVTCSKGTYIRSLVRDMALAMDTGAYMSALRRTKIGDYDVNDAILIEDFVAKYGKKREENP